MARYFFEVHDGEVFAPDDQGVELANLDAAKNAAVVALADIARDELPDGRRAEFAIRVSDAAGTHIFTVKLAVAIE